MKQSVQLAFLVLASAGLSGCIATSQNYVELQGEISSLKRVISQMQENQADLTITMKELNGSMIGLTEKLEDNKERTNSLSQKLDDIESNLSAKIDNLSLGSGGSAQPQKREPSPSQLYDIAYNDYSQGRYELAGVGFRNYLERYPQGDLAEKAQYYLAHALQKTGDSAGALDAFEKFVRSYPRSEFFSDAEKNYRDLLKKEKSQKSAQPAADADKSTKTKEIEKDEKPKPSKPASTTTTTEKKPTSEQPEKKSPTIKISPDKE